MANFSFHQGEMQYIPVTQFYDLTTIYIISAILFFVKVVKLHGKNPPSHLFLGVKFLKNTFND